MGTMFERLLEENALRGKIREELEVKRLRAMTEVGPIDRALHVACGNGSATQLLQKHFSPRRFSGTDRDPSVIEDARSRGYGPAFEFFHREVTALGFGDGEFDAVFDLADLHNVEDWTGGLAEIHRVLKPGGLFIMEELSTETFESGAGKVLKRLTAHPYEAMLSIGAFRERALASGFEILGFEERNTLGLLRHFFMVARKRR